MSFYSLLLLQSINHDTAQKMKISIKDFFNKYDRICNFLRIWLRLLKKLLMESFVFKLMKIVNIEEENLHIFWTSWGISMKFPEKMSLMIILKVRKSQYSILFLRNTFLEKQKVGEWGGGRGVVKYTPPSSFRVNDTHREKLVPYWIKYKNSLKYKVGRFWRFLYVYTIN